MELWLTLILLYAWQCVAWLPARSAAVTTSWRRRGALSQAGPRWLPPWPSTLCVIGSRIPFRLDAERLAAEIPLGRTAVPPDRVTRTIAIDASSEVEPRGHRVSIDGQPFVTAASRVQARRLADMLTALAALPNSERGREIRTRLISSLDWSGLSKRLGAARGRVRWLGRVCDAEASSLFVAVPALGLWIGAERALLLTVPILLGLHVAGVVLAIRAHRGLFPDARAARLEEMWMAALYPPALLRLPQRLVDDAVAGFHPLALARVLWPESAWREALTHEITWLERRARLDPEAAAWCTVQQAVLIETANLPDGTDLVGPRPRRDPTAASYCPLCLDDFRPGYHRCRTCGIETVAYTGCGGGAHDAEQLQ